MSLGLIGIFILILIVLIFMPQKKQPEISTLPEEITQEENPTQGDTWKEVTIGGREFINTTPEVINQTNDRKLTLVKNNDGTFDVISLDYQISESDIRKELNISDDILFTINIPGAASPKYYEDIE